MTITVLARDPAPRLAGPPGTLGRARLVGPPPSIA